MFFQTWATHNIDECLVPSDSTLIDQTLVSPGCTSWSKATRQRTCDDVDAVLVQSGAQGARRLLQVPGLVRGPHDVTLDLRRRLLPLAPRLPQHDGGVLREALVPHRQRQPARAVADEHVLARLWMAAMRIGISMCMQRAVM